MYRQMVILTLLAAIIIAVTPHRSYLNRYCNLCYDGRAHIACNPPESYCPDNGVRFIRFNTSMINLILEEHNSKRNKIAGGNIKRFKKACRMATMDWSNELADLAALNVEQCQMKHDQCHNTPDFLYSGQNLALSGSSFFRSHAESVESAINEWYSEIRDTDWGHMKSYPTTNLPKPIGHFTVMMADRNTHVGCAAVTFPKQRRFDTMNMFLLVCNYATTNMKRYPIYKPCETAAEECDNGCNFEYPNLCSADEEYAVNEW